MCLTLHIEEDLRIEKTFLLLLRALYELKRILMHPSFIFFKARNAAIR